MISRLWHSLVLRHSQGVQSSLWMSPVRRCECGKWWPM